MTGEGIHTQVLKHWYVDTKVILGDFHTILELNPSFFLHLFGFASKSGK